MQESETILCPVNGCNGTLSLVTKLTQVVLVCQTNSTHKFDSWSKKRGAY